MYWRLLSLILGLLGTAAGSCLAEEPARACKILVVDAENEWPVPLIELRTTHHLRFVTDNAGVIAMDAPELLGRETWFGVHGHGYTVPADGFGYRGVRLTPKPGETLTVKVQRDNIAKRIGRLTGSGLFAESQKLGEMRDWVDGPIVGSDSVQLATYRDRLMWAWGDTTLYKYPLGIFNASGATTPLQPLKSFTPPLTMPYSYFHGPDGGARGVANVPGPGPTWLSAYFTVKDEKGQERFCATYSKITPPLTTYEVGLCMWDDDHEEFRPTKVLWKKDSGEPQPKHFPDGHPARWTDADGKRWLLFGNPLPKLRCPDSLAGWQNPKRWEPLSPPETLSSVSDSKPIKLHSGSIAWNAHRQRWVTVFMQHFGKASPFGELWYAEANDPLGEWGSCVQILTHDNYTFYNPRIQTEITPADADFLLFEATYTQEFANKPMPTPRYDYNQMLYRLNLNDPRLKPAQK
jgi:hypothetical protein